MVQLSHGDNWHEPRHNQFHDAIAEEETESAQNGDGVHWDCEPMDIPCLEQPQKPSVAEGEQTGRGILHQPEQRPKQRWEDSHVEGVNASQVGQIPGENHERPKGC
jgi:hypothetical protein